MEGRAACEFAAARGDPRRRRAPYGTAGVRRQVAVARPLFAGGVRDIAAAMHPFPALATLPARVPGPARLHRFPELAVTETEGVRETLRHLEVTELPVTVHRNAVLHPLGPWLGAWWQGGAQDEQGAFIPETGLYHWAQSVPVASLEGGDPQPPVAMLDETLVWGGFLPAHHGHFIIDSLSRLWRWPVPGAHRLACIGKPDEYNPVMWDMLAKAGVPRDAILMLDRPTRVRELIVPYPSSLCYAISSDAWAATVRRVGDAAVPGAVERSGQPLYLSRSRFATAGYARGVAGEAVLEQVLRQAGFAVAYPEELDLAQAVALVRRHTTVVAQLGSALHWTAFTDAAPDIIGIAATPVPASYLLCDSAVGARAHYIWGPDAGIAAPQLPAVDAAQHSVALDLPAVVTELTSLGLLPAGTPVPAAGRRPRVEAQYLRHWHRILGEYARKRPEDAGFSAAQAEVAARLARLGG